MIYVITTFAENEHRVVEMPDLKPKRFRHALKMPSLLPCMIHNLKQHIECSYNCRENELISQSPLAFGIGIIVLIKSFQPRPIDIKLLSNKR